MKISRKRLRKIINEFLDTSRPVIDQPIPDLEDLTSTSVYDQLTNSERAAFISAMEIAGGKSLNQNLNEGSIVKGPQRWFEEDDFEEDHDSDGDVTSAELESADLIDDREHEEDEIATAIEMLARRYQSEKARQAELAAQGVEMIPSRFMRNAESDEY